MDRDERQLLRYFTQLYFDRRIHQRFEKGASLWMIRSVADGRLAGFGWSLQGGTIEPYYFPLAPDDVHLFDFHVYEEYRGQGLNPLLVGHILSTVAREADGRAFIECAEWNEPQLASLKKTPFHRLGLVSTTTLFRRVFTRWTDGSERNMRRSAEAKDEYLPIAGSHGR
jgi:GNAT superfamily N-acetyltransferase